MQLRSNTTNRFSAATTAEADLCVGIAASEPPVGCRHEPEPICTVPGHLLPAKCNRWANAHHHRRRPPNPTVLAEKFLAKNFKNEGSGERAGTGRECGLHGGAGTHRISRDQSQQHQQQLTPLNGTPTHAASLVDSRLHM